MDSIGKRGVGALLAGITLVPVALANFGVEMIPGDRRSTAISTGTDSDAYVVQGLEGGNLTVIVRARSGDLRPRLSMLRPDFTPADLTGRLREGPDAAKIVRYPVDQDGAHIITVIGDAGTTGEYSVKVKAKRPPRSRTSLVVAVGQVVDIPFDGVAGGSVTFRVSHETVDHTQKPLLIGPDGLEVPGSAAFIGLNRNTDWAGRRIPLTGGTGTYRIRLLGPTKGASAIVTVGYRPGFSTDRRTRVRIPVLEPVLTEVTPFTVKLGQGVSALGSNFSAQARVVLRSQLNPAQVLEGTVTSVSGDGSTLTFRVPDGASNQYDVFVCNPEGQASDAGPSIAVNSGTASSAGVSPSTGPASGGTLVTVTGAGFVSPVTINLKAADGTLTPVTVNFNSSTQVTFNTPVHPAGTVSLVILNGDGVTTTRTAAFTFTDETQSRFYANATGTAMPALSQSGDSFAASQGAVVDLNLDGRADLVLQSAQLLPAGASLRILHQNAAGVLEDDTHRSIPDRYGGFDTATDLGEGPGLAVGDLDGDSFPDIVVAGFGYVPLADNTGANVEYRRAGAADSDAPFGMSQTCGKIGEFPIFWNDHYSATRIFKNDGNGNFFSSPFGASGARRMPVIGFYVDGTAAADADTASYAATYTVVTDVLNPKYPGYYRGDQGFVDSGVTGGERFEADAVALGDLDGDGALDMVLARDGAVTESVCVEFQRGSGLNPFETFLTAGRPSTRVLFNGVSAGVGTGVFTETPFPLFDPSQFAFPDTGYDDRGQASDLAVTDVNGDGLPDIVLVSDRRFELTHTRPGGPVTEYRPGTRVFLNKGGSKFDDATRSNLPVVDVGPVASPDFFAASRIATGDIDGDGDADIVIASRSGIHIAGGRPWTRVLVNRDGPSGPTGIFDDATPTQMPPVAGVEVWQANSIALFDVDEDGDPDLVLTTTDPALTATKPGTRVLINDGTGKFENNPTGVSADSFIPPQGGGELWQGDLVLVGDLDGNGLADIVVSEDDPAVANATRILLRK